MQDRCNRLACAPRRMPKMRCLGHCDCQRRLGDLVKDEEDLKFYKIASSRLSYSPDLGVFRWVDNNPLDRHPNNWHVKHCGEIAGWISVHGYSLVSVTAYGKRKQLFLHRLAWFISTGFIPAGEIDHINQIKHDNRISNLRDVERFVNLRNKGMNSKNTSGVTGVTWNRRLGAWVAQANLFGAHKHLGVFKCLDEAEKAAKGFRELNQFTDRHGKSRAKAGEVGHE